MLYAVFAWGAVRRKTWAWPLGMVAAVTAFAVVPLLFDETGAVWRRSGPSCPSL